MWLRKGRHTWVSRSRTDLALHAWMSVQCVGGKQISCLCLHLHLQQLANLPTLRGSCRSAQNVKIYFFPPPSMYSNALNASLLALSLPKGCWGCHQPASCLQPPSRHRWGGWHGNASEGRQGTSGSRFGSCSTKISLLSGALAEKEVGKEAKGWI